MSQLLTLKDLCRRWQCKRWTVDNARAKGLKSLKVGGLRFRIEDVEAFEQQQAGSKTRPQSDIARRVRLAKEKLLAR